MPEDKQFEPMGDGPFVYDLDICDRGTRKVFYRGRQLPQRFAVAEILRHTKQTHQEAEELLEFSRRGRGTAAYRKDDMSSNVEITIQPYSKVAQNVMDQDNSARYNVSIYDLEHCEDVRSLSNLTADEAVDYVVRQLDMPVEKVKKALHFSDNGRQPSIYNPRLSLEAHILPVPVGPSHSSSAIFSHHRKVEGVKVMPEDNARYNVVVYDLEHCQEVGSVSDVTTLRAVSYISRMVGMPSDKIKSALHRATDGHEKVIYNPDLSFEARVTLVPAVPATEPEADISARRFAFTIFHARTGVPIFFNSDIDEATFRHALIDTLDSDEEKIDGIISLTKVGLLRLEFTPADSVPMVLSAAAITY